MKKTVTCFIIILALVFLFPLSWALTGAGKLIDPITVPVSFSHPHGRVGNGAVRFGMKDQGLVENQSIQNLEIDLRYRLLARRVLTPTPVNFSLHDLGLSARGFVGLAQFQTVNAVADLAVLSKFDPRLAGIRGRVELMDAGMKWRDKQCETASGEIRSDILRQNENLWQWRGPKITGKVSCQNGMVQIGFEGQNQEIEIEGEFSFGFTGHYKSETRLRIHHPQQGVLMALRMIGFEQSEPSVAESALPDSSLPNSSLPNSSLPNSSLPNSSLNDAVYRLSEQGNFLQKVSP